MERSEKEKILDIFNALKGERILLLKGEEGIGKTYILRELCDEASKRGFCIYTKYSEIPREEFFYSIIESIKKQIPSLRLGVIEVLSKKATDNLSTLISVISVLASFKSIMIIFDDAEKYGREVIDGIFFLLKSLQESNLMVIIAYDENFIGENLRQLFIKLKELPEGIVSEIELSGFSMDDTRKLIKGMNYDLPEYVIEKIQNATQGNPGKIKDILLQMKASGLIDKDNYWVGTFEDLPRVRSRKIAQMDLMNILSEDEIEFLLYASAYGHEFRADHIAEIRGMSNEKLVSIINSLLNKNIIEERENSTYKFSRPEYQEIIYNSASSIKKRYIHKRIAEFLEKSCRCPETIGRHYYLAGLQDRARDYLLEASEIKFREGNYRESYELLKRYLEITPEPEKRSLYMAIDDLIKLGRYSEALNYVDMAKKRIVDEIDLRIREAYIYYNIGDYQSAERIISNIEEKKERDEILILYYLIRGGIGIRRLNLEEAEKDIKKALDISLKLGDGYLIATSYKELGNLNYYSGNLEKAYEYYLQSLNFYERIMDYEGMSRIYNNLSLIEINRDAMKALDHYQKSLIYADMSGNIYLSIAIRLNISQLYFWTGRVKEAEKEIGIGFELSKITGEMEIRHSIYSYLTDIFVLKGDFDNALKNLDEAIRISGDMGATFFRDIYELKKKEILAMMGRFEGEISCDYDRNTIMGINYDLYNSIILLYQGKFSEASSLMDEALSRARGRFTILDIIIFEGNLPLAYLLSGDIEKFKEKYDSLKSMIKSLNIDFLYLHSYTPAINLLEGRDPELEKEEKFMVENGLRFLLLKTYIAYYRVSRDLNILERIKNIGNEIGFNYKHFIE
jgi:tetratricopeptide (TPR) repeat protein